MANLPVRVQFTLTCCICCQLSSIRRQGPKNTFRSEGEYRDQQLCNNDPKSIHHLCYWIIRYEKVIKTCVQEFSAKTGILKMFLFCLFFYTYVISLKLFIRICPSLHWWQRLSKIVGPVWVGEYSSGVRAVEPGPPAEQHHVQTHTGPQ